MSWTSDGYLNSPSYNEPPYEQQHYQNQHQSQSYVQYPTDNFFPASYSYNPQMNHNQFYCPNEYIQSVGNTHQSADGIDEPPLLEELGINFEHIFRKTSAVLNPFAKLDPSIIDDVDLAGPLVFCLAYASSLLLLGKIHFGYVYGIVSLGTVGMYGLLKLMASPDKPCSGVFVTSVLGYCLLPMVILSFASFLFKLDGILGMITAIIFVLWCSISASKLFSTSLAMIGQQFLVAYPCALFYGVFVLLTMF